MTNLINLAPVAKKKIFFVLLSMLLCWSAGIYAQCEYAEDRAAITFKQVIPGLLDGEFSVSATKKVRFSGGNLMYVREHGAAWSTGKFSFMEHQYDMVETNADPYCETDYANQDVVSLFGWGTSGWEGAGSPARVAYQPYVTTANASSYGVVSPRASSETLTGDNAKGDWGVYNFRDLKSSGWRTLTRAEWVYLLNSRSGNRYAKATVHSVTGLIILPDGWTQASATLSGINSTSAAFTAISDDDWTKLEGEGAVFLPAAGLRVGEKVQSVGTSGLYWSSSAESTSFSYRLGFWSGGVNPQDDNYRFHGCSVRLVMDVVE